MKILVLNASAVHLGYLGCYGNEWVETPTLDRLAAEGVVFDSHIADCPTSDRSGPGSARTGAYRFPLPDGEPRPVTAPTIDALLQQHGAMAIVLPAESEEISDDEAFVERIAAAVQTLAKTENALLWIDWPDLTPPWEIPDEILDLYFGADIIEGADLTPWLDPPVGPFDVTAGNQLERLQESYAAVVTTFDALVEMILELLDEHGGRDGWHIIVTARAGLALGEHGILGAHRPWLHEEIVHLPLLMRFPQRQHSGLRIPALTQPVDLPATIAELFQLPLSGSDGRSLLPLVREEVDEIRAFACSALQVGDGLEWALRTPEWAFVLPLQQPASAPPRKRQLFVKPDDRWEVNDLSQQQLELCDELEKTLRQFIMGDKEKCHAST